MPTKQVASSHLRDDGSRFQPQKRVMRIARLRPWPFSSTTVALASCSSDHFPKRRPLYLRCQGGVICPRAQAHILSRIVSGPRCARIPCTGCMASAAHGALEKKAMRGMVGSSGEASQSRASTQEHWPRHDAEWGQPRHSSSRPPGWDRDVSSTSQRSTP
ncbi:hypothetical protein BU24DRAFT_262600 [Aaosphaeria arxii CBS 175.79]|uniref:Uncharacterized protein n=1 Tax=Aaosphaeria arxii CBS 175.79 TaxID=1450172 RepID=A0A6A5XIS3_9PLEO|nr:uncharacterized protein BU24DRAFT_262600 [Aaosphaeria arxii CBS 175.79]KAF2013022.1 hypothetical protein BU24DRAFT_262600 [Aaosphaeria arxii CBS 175.79]